jgi:hypothetical protein
MSEDEEQPPVQEQQGLSFKEFLEMSPPGSSSVNEDVRMTWKNGADLRSQIRIFISLLISMGWRGDKSFSAPGLATLA